MERYPRKRKKISGNKKAVWRCLTLPIVKPRQTATTT
jgi:hypothetical protein